MASYTNFEKTYVIGYDDLNSNKEEITQFLSDFYNSPDNFLFPSKFKILIKDLKRYCYVFSINENNLTIVNRNLYYIPAIASNNYFPILP